MKHVEILKFKESLASLAKWLSVRLQTKWLWFRVPLQSFKESVSKKDFKKSQNEKRVENWKEKQIYGQLIRDMPGGTDKEKTWLWMRKCDLKILTEALICSE